ncbi:hypothetical protein cyc_07923 [Cyclospora cayetanensis]|uniref:Uncharacterized protein n=1 Tax=Cyclospora cayetanensis TaxID=88456 RepID=A0A1D3CVX5_9EIME|nr:hypothetical protein cyc_07923 [Cyclospora cayetanensis]
MPAELSSCDSASVSNYCASEVYSSSSSRVYSPFRPREDRRSSRTKLLDALRSTGSVLPLTESAANSSGNLSQEQQTQPEPPPFPLCNMGKKNEPRKHHVVQRFREGSPEISPTEGGPLPPVLAASSVILPLLVAAALRGLQSAVAVGGAVSSAVRARAAATVAALLANLRRRQEQLRNPQFSDLFGRPTPSPPAAVSGAAVATESGVDTTRSAVPKEDITAHERFHRAMRSSIDMGTQPPLPPTSARVRPLDTSLGLQQQKELRELTQAGKGGRFHAESRVFGRLCEEQDAKTKSEDGGLELVVLHLSGLARTHREEDLLRLIKGSERGPEGTPSPPLRLGALKVDIAADPITNECTGGAKVTLRYSGGPETLNQIVHKLSHANIRARVESIQ